MYSSSLYQRKNESAGRIGKTSDFGIQGIFFNKLVEHLIEQFGQDGEGLSTMDQKHDPVDEPDVSNKGAGMKDPGGGVGYQENIDDEIRQMVADNPEMNLNTFLNVLKSKGLTIAKMVPDTDDDENEENSEADTSSANDQALRGKESKHYDLNSSRQITFKEAGKTQRQGVGYTKFDCIMIEEGLGNFSDGFYYTKEALKSAVPLFEGTKMFADHPDRMEEELRPERSIKDVVGHYENVRYEENDGRGRVCSHACVMPDKQYEWVRGLLRDSVKFREKFPDKDFVALSINAAGDAASMDIDEFIKTYPIPDSAMPKLIEAKNKGLEQVRVVTAIDDARSCDLVTEAGAGGQISNFIENAGGVMKIQQTKKFKEARKKLMKEVGSSVAPSDEEVIKKMIKNELSEMGLGDDDKTADMAMEMYQGYREGGMDDEDSMKHMRKAVEMGKRIAEKHMGDDEEHKENDDHDDDEKKENDDEDEMKKKESAKKSNNDRLYLLEKQVVKLSAENSVLKGSVTKRDLGDYLDKKLKESKMPRSITKSFRETIGEVRSRKELDEKWKLFSEAYNQAVKEKNAGYQLDGKGYGADGGEADEGSMNFSDCAE